MRKITVPTLAAAVSLGIFACSESPSSPSDDSSSSVVPSSSSVGGGGSSSSLVSSSSSLVSSSSSSSSFSLIGGRACQYPGEDFGISGNFVCGEAPSDMADLQAYRSDCESEDGVWANACPSGEKTTCIYEEDEYDKEVLYKIYADGFACGDLMMKNADGSDDIVQKGGACGPFFPYGENTPLSMCIEFPELPTGALKLSCAALDAPFASECPRNASLVCYNPEEEAISHFYGEALSSFTCEDLGMEGL